MTFHSDLRKAAEMALEALGNAYSFIPLTMRSAEINRKAIEALRQALAMERFSEVNQELEEALKQPEQAAFHRLLRIMGTFDFASGHANNWDDLLDSLETELNDVLGFYRARREWVGLTKDDIKDVCSLWEIAHGGWVNKLAKDIEAKLKEKNT